MASQSSMHSSPPTQLPFAEATPLPPPITVKYKTVTITCIPAVVGFMKTMLQVITPREEACNPSFPCDRSRFLVAGDFVDYLLTTLCARFPDLDFLGAVHQKKWGDAHDRAFLA